MSFLNEAILLALSYVFVVHNSNMVNPKFLLACKNVF